MTNIRANSFSRPVWSVHSCRLDPLENVSTGQMIEEFHQFLASKGSKLRLTTMRGKWRIYD